MDMSRRQLAELSFSVPQRAQLHDAFRRTASWYMHMTHWQDTPPRYP